MSTLVSKKKFTELLRTIIKKEIDEASTTATAGGEYDTPNAFSGKGKDRRNSVASGSGFEKVNEIRAVAFQGLKDSEGQMWDLFWREKPPYVIPFNKSKPKIKVKDIKDIKLKKSVLNVLKAVRTESVNEADMKAIANVVKKRQAKKIDGMLMDLTTANAVIKVYKALNRSNEKKFAELPLKKMVNVTWKLVK